MHHVAGYGSPTTQFRLGKVNKSRIRLHSSGWYSALRGHPQLCLPFIEWNEYYAPKAFQPIYVPAILKQGISRKPFCQLVVNGQKDFGYGNFMFRGRPKPVAAIGSTPCAVKEASQLLA